MKTNIIAFERKRKGWTKSELARRIGVTAPVITHIELGRNKSPKTLFKIAEVLNIPIERLIS